MEGKTAGDLFYRASDIIYSIGGWTLLGGATLLFVAIVVCIIKKMNQPSSMKGD